MCKGINRRRYYRARRTPRDYVNVYNQLRQNINRIKQRFEALSKAISKQTDCNDENASQSMKEFVSLRMSFPPHSMIESKTLNYFSFRI